jgi:hypothetical protein
MLRVSLAASPCTKLWASRSLPARSTNTTLPCLVHLKEALPPTPHSNLMLTVSKLHAGAGGGAAQG